MYTHVVTPTYIVCMVTVNSLLSSTLYTILYDKKMSDISGALVQFGCYHHSINGNRPHPVIKL